MSVLCILHLLYKYTVSVCLVAHVSVSVLSFDSVSVGYALSGYHHIIYFTGLF